MKNEQRIRVGYNDAEAYNHQTQSNLKLEVLQEAVAEFKKQTNGDIDDLAEFEAGFYDYTLSYIKAKHKGGAVLGLHDEQFINLYGYNFDLLKTIEAKYYTQLGSIKIFKNIASVDESLDFGIYCENEREVEKYEAVTELIKVATNIYDRYFSGQIPIQSMKYMNRLFISNSDATGLVVNPNFIKNE
jgi:hypothetical protein